MTAAIRQRKLNYLQRLILICDLTHHLRIASPDSKSLSKPVLPLIGIHFEHYHTITDQMLCQRRHSFLEEISLGIFEDFGSFALIIHICYSIINTIS